MIGTSAVVCGSQTTQSSSRGRESSRGRGDKKIMTWCPKCEVHLCVG